jgi:hypothetical protein
MPNWFWFPKTLPHTFLNTIFINETEYNNREIEAELYTHELTCDSKHVGYFIIELLKTVFWFNPIFIFLQNHTTQPRFLAEKVVTILTMFRSTNLYYYQSEREPNFYLASNLNYLITKNDYSWWQNHIKKTFQCLRNVIAQLLYSLFSLCTKLLHEEKNTTIVQQQIF